MGHRAQHQPQGRVQLHQGIDTAVHEAAQRAHHQHRLRHRVDRQRRTEQLRCQQGRAHQLLEIRGQGAGATGVTANAIAPGFIETDMTAVLDEKVRGHPRARPDVQVWFTDIAHTAVFLAMEPTGRLTGAHRRWWHGHVSELFGIRA